jgi:hypothetical protein
MVPLYNFFDGSSITSGCNLADNIGTTEKENNIDGRSGIDPTVMELSDDHDDQDADYTEKLDISIKESEDEIETEETEEDYTE